MTNYKLPKGVQDTLVKECYAKNKVTEKLRRAFSSYGYNEIAPPAIEYMNLFTEGSKGVSVKELFKFTDNDGSILALRPDFTLPIARIVATKLSEELPVKLCYFGNCFKMNEKEYSYREFYQAGAELIGSDSLYADYEIITLAIKCLLNSGLKDFQIDIGNVGYVKGILSDLKLESEAEEEIITVIGKKNMLGLKEIAKKYKIPATHLELLNQLPLTFGDREILLKAEKKALNSISKEALERLISLDKLLCENGYGKYVTYDLGLINSISYYSGIVFKGISVHFGSPLLSGGRYDNLLAGFGKDLPAIGFAVGMEHLMLALNYAGLLDCGDEKEIFVGYKKGSEKKAFEICYDYRKKGINASLLFEQNIKNMKKLKSSNPTGEYLYVEQDKAEKIL